MFHYLFVIEIYNSEDTSWVPFTIFKSFEERPDFSFEMKIILDFMYQALNAWVRPVKAVRVQQLDGEPVDEACEYSWR